MMRLTELILGLAAAVSIGFVPPVSASPFPASSQPRKSPPMGWNTWNHFGCDISEDIIVSAATALVKTGLKDLGYEYVIIDDCWHAPSRHNITQEPQADPIKFPRGMKHLADRIHALGLKFGIYSDAGTYTCGGRFGSLGFEEVDAKTYAEWGVDYLKYDNCFNEGLSGSQSKSFKRYEAMSRALSDTGRPTFYAMCNWGEDAPWEWAPKIADSWRISGDIYDEFSRYNSLCPCESLSNCTFFGHHCAVTRIVDWAAPLGQYTDRGGWNDLDMLEVGNGKMSYDEYVSHFSMWALLKSPLILGNDLTNMTAETISIITNSELIKINQDPSSVPARRLWKRLAPGGGDVQLWVGTISKDETVVAVLNTSPTSLDVYVSFAEVFGDNSEARTSQDVRDLWRKDDAGRWGRDMGVHDTGIKALVKPHQTKVWKLKAPPPPANLLVQ